MKNTVLSDHLHKGDHFFCPRLGAGKVLHHQTESTMKVLFARNSNTDLLFFRHFVSPNHNRTPRFILSTRCAECNTEVEIDLTILGDTGEPGFRNVSLLCQTPEVAVKYTPTGIPLYIHLPCGERLIPGEARPVLKDI